MNPILADVRRVVRYLREKLSGDEPVQDPTWVAAAWRCANRLG